MHPTTPLKPDNLAVTNPQLHSIRACPVFSNTRHQMNHYNLKSIVHLTASPKSAP